MWRRCFITKFDSFSLDEFFFCWKHIAFSRLNNLGMKAKKRLKLLFYFQHSREKSISKISTTTTGVFYNKQKIELFSFNLNFVHLSKTKKNSGAKNANWEKKELACNENINEFHLFICSHSSRSIKTENLIMHEIYFMWIKFSEKNFSLSEVLIPSTLCFLLLAYPLGISSPLSCIKKNCLWKLNWGNRRLRKNFFTPL